MRSLALAVCLAASGCATSQSSGVAGYVETTRAVVDVALDTYVALAEQRAAVCDQYADAARFAECIGVLRVPQVASAARLIEQAQLTFLAAYNAGDLAGAARAVAELGSLVTHFKELINNVRSSRRP